MFRLDGWRTRCERAKSTGAFTSDDRYLRIRTDSCAIAEAGTLLGVSYETIMYTDEIVIEKTRLRNAEVQFTEAVVENRPKDALAAIAQIEEILLK